MKKYRRQRIFYHHGDKLLTKLTLPTISIKRYIPNVYNYSYLPIQKTFSYEIHV